MRRFLFGVLFLLGYLVTCAQSPCFNAIDTIGCVPFTVDLTDCSGAAKSNIVYVFEENGKLDSTTSPSFTFNTPGPHSVSQLVGTTDGIKTLTKKNYIRVVSPSSPQFKLFACEGLSLLTKINDVNYQKYIIKYPDNSPNDTTESNQSVTHTFATNGSKEISVTGIFEDFSCSASEVKIMQTIIDLEEPQITQLISEQSSSNLSFYTNELLEYKLYNGVRKNNLEVKDTISFSPDSTTFTFTHPKGQNEFVYVTSFDRCSNFKSSDTLQTIQLSAVSKNNLNEIFWTAYDNQSHFEDYILTKNKQNNNVTVNNYIDQDIKCGAQYCYRVSIKTKKTNTTSKLPTKILSNQECVEAVSNNIPDTIKNLQSSIVNDSLRLYWSPLTSPNVTAFYLDGFNSLLETNPLDTFSTKDTTYAVQRFTSNCFTLNYQDVCGNYAEKSVFTCPIKLNITKNENPNQELRTATWTNYNNTTNLPYTLTLFNKRSDVIFQENINGSNSVVFSWPNEEDQQIWATITTEYNSSLTTSNRVEIEEASYTIFPNAFTPNNDNLNDVFQPSGRFIDFYNLKIYNSLGIIIFASTRENTAWDGRYNDSPAPPGTYYYEAVIQDKKGEIKKMNGEVSLIY